jgi:hypothetical protein
VALEEPGPLPAPDVCSLAVACDLDACALEAATVSASELSASP